MKSLPLAKPKPGKMPRRPREKVELPKGKKFKFRKGHKKSYAICNKCQYRTNVGPQECPRCSGKMYEYLNWKDYHKRRIERWEHDKRKCTECKKALPDPDSGWESDHQIKRSLRGPDNMWNLKTKCNGLFGCHEKRHREEEGL